MTTHERKYSLVPRAVAAVHSRYRHIVTQLPVPESVPLLEELERLEPSSMQGQPPMLIDRSEGWQVHDRWGNTWLDWSSGVLISNVGNSSPAIVAAIREMLERPLLSTYVFAHEKRLELVRLLNGLAPSPDYKTFLLTTGSEATENCIKLARTWGQRTRGPDCRYFLTFQNCFHGRTMGAQLAGGSP
ncbi:MAG TPA: aminotransferase class III-fold pyridoxal phosphate-dependent enzyme, partial [Spirochaetia bacterium]|nr:aminotransferase class III-fold pyridoxal phosphate-dependent enzyme [Spirochaetia bacterium]